MSQALPIRMGTGSPYFIPALATPLWDKSKSWHTSRSRGCFALSAASRSRHGLFLCVQRVVLMETNSWGLWDKFFRWLMGRCLGFSLFLFLLFVRTDSQSPQQNLPESHPIPETLTLCLLELRRGLWHYWLSRHGWFSNLNQMSTKEGFLFHLVRISLVVILLSGIFTDLISPLPNETFCIIHYLYL